MDTFTWYKNLVKPWFAPPAWLFGPAWTFLYILIAISFGKVFIMFIQKKVPFIVVLPFILNLVFNFAFSPIQFGLRNNVLASLDIIFILGTIIWLMFAIWPYSRLVVYLQIPYLLWVSFATILQLSVTYLNR